MIQKVQIDLARLHQLIDSDAGKKKQLRELLSVPRQTVSKMVTGKRAILAEELLTIAAVYDVDPMELALQS